MMPGFLDLLNNFGLLEPLNHLLSQTSYGDMPGLLDSLNRWASQPATTGGLAFVGGMLFILCVLCDIGIDLRSRRMEDRLHDLEDRHRTLEDRLRKTEDRLREIDGRLPVVDRSDNSEVRASPFRITIRPDENSSCSPSTATALGPRHWKLVTRLRPPVQPNKASSRDARLPDLRAIVAATTLQSRAISSLLASSARLSAIE
jgi:hypothetical protein